MTGLAPVFITGYAPGLITNKKPFLLPDQAWSELNNAYSWRDRVLKREGLKLLGRLTRVLMDQSLGTTVAGPPNTVTINTIFTALSIPEANAELEPDNLIITVGAPDSSTFTDLGNGKFSVTGAGVASGSYVNYTTGEIVLEFSALTGGGTITANFNYYPALPVMGIASRDLSLFNQQQTIWWDQTYAYIWNGSGFNEFIPGTTWASTNSDFFWWFNYRGGADNMRLLFESNFVNSSTNPMRYTDGSTWSTFQPAISATGNAPTSVIYTAKIILSYYGRLLLLNTYEGTVVGGNASALNYFNRARWCAYASSPIDNSGASPPYFPFRTDQIGLGGFLDSPTNEAIISATFLRNTLVVTFEQTVWQLRYLGEYGAPFVWERVSSDFGSESTFSSVLFDNHMLVVGDKGIIAATGNAVDRIDLDIPDTVFGFKNANNGTERIFGIRNYQKEVVYWNYPDSTTGTGLIFPNKVLLYNYRNNSWAIFRDNVTAFGTFQNSLNVTWDSLTVTWDSNTTLWDDVQSQSLFPSITSGNQQGFVSLYQEDAGFEVTTPIQEEPSLSITAVNLSLMPIQITVINHNLLPGEIIYIIYMMFIDSTTFLPITTNLNNQFYQVQVIDANTLSLYLWDFTNEVYINNFSFVPTSNFIYVGGGVVTLVPRLYITSKDINLFQAQGLQTKLSRIDFLMQPSSASAVTVNLITNARPSPNPTLPTSTYNPVWSGEMSTVLTPAFYAPSSDYAWFRYYATLAAQYFKINLTYDDNLMNTESTHYDPFTLYAINAWIRKGGKNVF